MQILQFNPILKPNPRSIDNEPERNIYTKTHTVAKCVASTYIFLYAAKRVPSTIYHHHNQHPSDQIQVKLDLTRDYQE